MTEQSTIYIGPSVDYVRRILARNALDETLLVIEQNGRPAVSEGGLERFGITDGPARDIIVRLVSALVTEGMSADTMARIARVPSPDQTHQEQLRGPQSLEEQLEGVQTSDTF